MSLVELLASPVGRLLTAALVHFLWQGLAVAALLALLVEVIGLRRPAARYACSLTALAVMMACPVVTMICFGAGEYTTASAFKLIQAEDGSTVIRQLGDSESMLGQFGFSSAHALAQLQPYLLAVWFAGVALLGSRLLAGAIGIFQLRRSREALPPKLASAVELLGKRMHVDALPQVFLSRQVAEAMAVGVLWPLVLIPASWATEMPVEMLEAVIAHELAHLRRRDLWVILAQRVLETLLFYHPAVWWLSRRLRIERELCADELAVAATGQRVMYAKTLEQVAHWRRADVSPLLVAFMRGEQDMRVLERVRNVLGRQAGERSRLWPAGVLALALPLAAWAASLGLISPLSRVATADDERKVIILREGDEDDDDRPVKRSADDRGSRKETVERKIIRKGDDGDEKRPIKAETKGRGGDARIDELTALVKRLAERVERLQAELNEVRGVRKREGSEDARRKERREDEEREEAEVRERKQYRELAEQKERATKEKVAAKDKQAMLRAREEAEEEKREAVEKQREAEERAARDKRRAEEEKERANREEGRAKESLERKIRDQAEARKREGLNALDDEKIKIFVEKVRADAEKKTAQARGQGEKAVAEALEQAERAKAEAQDAVKRAVARKKQIAIEKKDRDEDGEEKPVKKKPLKEDDEE